MHWADGRIEKRNEILSRQDKTHFWGAIINVIGIDYGEDRTTASHALDLTWICCMEGERENNWAGMGQTVHRVQSISQCRSVVGGKREIHWGLVRSMECLWLFNQEFTGDVTFIHLIRHTTAWQQPRSAAIRYQTPRTSRVWSSRVRADEEESVREMLIAAEMLIHEIYWHTHNLTPTHTSDEEPTEN